MTDSKIAILSTVINFDLYAKSSQFFPKDIQKYVIDGRNGMHGLDSIFYMMEKLRNKNPDWLIMADEDVLFQDSAVVFDIIKKMQSENYMVCGVRDGGMITHRIYNPYAINTFFSIINFKELEKIWNKKEILRNHYIGNDEFKDDLTNLPGQYDVKSIYEPYYGFYFWLRRKNKKILFLNAEMNSDEIANTVLYNDKVFLHHTWFARSYGINEILELLHFEGNKTSDPIIFKDKTFFLIQKIKKNCQRIVRRFNKK
jgi:hypothetical protein